MNDIVEVIELGRSRIANEYLEHGYRMLHVGHVNEFIVREGHPGWVRHGFLYVMGRTADVPHYDRPPRQVDVPTPAEPATV